MYLYKTMLTSFFVSLSGWTVLSKMASFFIGSKKHSHFVGMLHNLSSVYLLNNNCYTEAITNSLGYYTNDIMRLVYMDYYTTSERVTFILHHLASIFFFVNKNDDTYYPTMTVFRRIELSNLALFNYYYLSKVTRDPVILAVANTVETAVYGYYRVGLIYYLFHFYPVIKHHYIHLVLSVGLYGFGVYYTCVLSNMAFTRVLKLTNG